MNQIAQPSAVEVQPAPSHWIGRVVIAVLVAEGIWGLIVSLTRDVIVPFLARQMGADPQSPLYLGKGELNVPGIFAAVLQLCLAGLVAIVLNTWVSRTRKAVLRTVVVRPSKTATIAPPPTVAPESGLGLSSTPAAPAPMASPHQPAAPPSTPAPRQTPYAAPTPSTYSAPPAPTQPPLKPLPVAQAPAKPSKSQPPREVQYNIVGEPISPMEEDE